MGRHAERVAIKAIYWAIPIVHFLGQLLAGKYLVTEHVKLGLHCLGNRKMLTNDIRSQCFGATAILCRIRQQCHRIISFNRLLFCYRIADNRMAVKKTYESPLLRHITAKYALKG